MTLSAPELYFRFYADARGAPRRLVRSYDSGTTPAEKQMWEIFAAGIDNHYGAIGNVPIAAVHSHVNAANQTPQPDDVFFSADDRNAWELIRAAWTVWTESAYPEQKTSPVPLWADDRQRDGWIAVWRRARQMCGGLKIDRLTKEKGLTGDWEKDKPEGPVDLLEITKGLVGRRR